EQKFSDTAWWLASGWDKHQIVALQNSSTAAKTLDGSAAFAEDLDRAKKYIKAAEAGSFNRANTLNGLGWTLATWGIHLKGENTHTRAPTDNCQSTARVPGTALQRASAAV